MKKLPKISLRAKLGLGHMAAILESDKRARKKVAASALKDIDAAIQWVWVMWSK